MLPMLFASCSKEAVEETLLNEVYTVQLGMGGELDIIYEPLTKSSTDDLYGIQVYSMPDIDGASAWTAYAYGLFDDASNITIKLLKGYKYKFEATMLVDGKNKLYGYTGPSYSFPFFAYGTSSEHSSVGDQFNYTSITKFNGLNKGESTIKDDGGYSSYARPNVERYYGELENYIPGRNGEKAVISMSRTSFGVKYQVIGKDSGTIEIMMEGAPKMIFELAPGNTEKSDVFTFSKVYDAWKNADNEYSETVKTSVNWYRGDGTVVPLGTHEIVFKRNMTTVVKIDVSNDGANTGLGFQIDETGAMPEVDGGTITGTDF